VNWVDAGPVKSIPPRGARVLRVDGHDIAVFRTGDDRVFALRDKCPHRGGPLSQGIVHDHCVTCPLHDWVIDLATGVACGPDEGTTAIYGVRVEQGRVLVGIACEPSVAAA
jgi:nitrite reductase (NADH) small subunit